MILEDINAKCDENILVRKGSRKNCALLTNWGGVGVKKRLREAIIREKKDFL